VASTLAILTLGSMALNVVAALEYSGANVLQCPHLKKVIVSFN
jgi:hypothetical protein